MVCCTADGCAYNNTANCVNNLWGQYFQEDCEGNCDALCEAPITPFCGDGNLDPGEECDDGNFLDGDGCASDCTLEQDVPTTTGIGVALMVLLLGGSSAYFLRRK
jgi:cysteine-rich repeat protein